MSQHKKVYIPLHEETVMQDVDLQVKTMMPCCLMLHEEHLETSDWPYVVILNAEGTVVLKRNVGLFPQDVELAMQACVDIDSTGVPHTFCGALCNVTQQCHNIIFVHATKPQVHVPCPNSIRFLRCHEYFFMKAHVDRIEDVRQFLYLTGIDKIIKAVGWELTMTCSCEPQIDEAKEIELRLTRIPGRLALQPSHFENVIRARVFTGLLDEAVSYAPDVTRISIKLWNTWVWTNWVSTDANLNFITQSWLKANRFFGSDAEMRLIKDGKMLNPDMKVRDYVNPRDQHETFKAHLVLQLRGGGPPPPRALHDVRDEPTELDQGDDSGDDVRLVTIHDDAYGTAEPYSRVSDNVEDTVAVMLKKLVDMTTEDVYLEEHVITISLAFVLWKNPASLACGVQLPAR